MAYTKPKRVLLWIILGLILIFILDFSSPLYAAELWLRESLVRNRSQDILTSIDVVPVNIGKKAHTINEDCDLHVPLRSEDIKVPMVGESRMLVPFQRAKRAHTGRKSFGL